MDSFEINKIIAAVLLTVLIIIGIGKFTDVLFHVEKPKESAYKIEGLEVVSASNSSSGTEAKVVEAEAEVPLALAEAFRSGNLGVMDYYRLNNIKADTDMRDSISKEGEE